MRGFALWSVAALLASAPGTARAESLHLSALRVARHHYPSKGGYARVSVEEAPALVDTSGRRIVTFDIHADGRPIADPLVIFECAGDDCTSLGVARRIASRSSERRVTLLVEHPKRKLVCALADHAPSM
jgi:hypothetical protein